jgi:hypothetical protein
MHSAQCAAFRVEADAALRHRWLETVGREFISAEYAGKITAIVVVPVNVYRVGASQDGFRKHHESVKPARSMSGENGQIDTDRAPQKSAVPREGTDQRKSDHHNWPVKISFFSNYRDAGIGHRRA